MQKTIIIKGRLIGPRNVELDQAVSLAMPEVEVVVHQDPMPRSGQLEKISDFVRDLPDGTRNKSDIDSELQMERDCWGNR